MSENTHVYIGTLPCGCIVAAAVDIIDDRKSTAHAVKEMIASGCSVSRVALNELRNGSVKLAGCIHKQGTLPL